MAAVEADTGAAPVDGVTDWWFEACEALLAADPGRRRVIPGEELAARLEDVLARLYALGADTGPLDRLRGMVERWRAAPPGAAQWFLDYRWLADQERLGAPHRRPPLMTRRVSISD